MTLHFPNQSRSYDPQRRGIRFHGHDGALEVAFFLEQDALFKLSPRTNPTEAEVLAAFDAARPDIFEVASRSYSPKRGSFYVLQATEF